MSQINFVPDDYIEKKESQKTSLFYLVMFVIVILVLCGGYGAIRMRKSAISAQEAAVDQQLTQAQQDLSRLETIQKKLAQVMNSASMSNQLIEPTPRSVVLACLVNGLPEGVFLSNIELVEKEKIIDVPVAASKYQNQKKKNVPLTEKKVQRKTTVAIEGYAHSDVLLAGYIANLSEINMFEQVLLDQSKESKIDDQTIRKYKINASIKEGYAIGKADIEQIAGVY